MTDFATRSSLDLNRRQFLSNSAVATAGGASLLTAGGLALPAKAQDDAFVYEVVRTEAEWRERLTEDEYKILRGGDTELPRTSDLWDETRNGTYHCKGCGLHLYSSSWKVPLQLGWVFFAHAEVEAVMLGVDGPQEAYGMNPDGFQNLIEVRCRRCGSHLGHMLIIDGEIVHCINGTALDFNPSEA